MAFCEAVYEGRCEVEGITARKVTNREKTIRAWERGEIPVLVDPGCTCLSWLQPLALVDGILAKKNLGTRIDMAPLTIGLGPGFTAGVDTDLVIETMRGESLARVYQSGTALPNTGVPGVIDGYASERVIYAPCSGEIRYLRQVGDLVKKGGTFGGDRRTDSMCDPDGIAAGSHSGRLSGHDRIKDYGY